MFELMQKNKEQSNELFELRWLRWNLDFESGGPYVLAQPTQAYVQWMCAMCSDDWYIKGLH